MGSGITEVPGGNPRKYLQVNIPVPTGSQHLNTHTDGGGHLSLKNPPNPQVPLRKLPYLVIFTCMGVTSLSSSTCGSHPSWMGVTTLVKKNTCRYHLQGPCGSPVLCPIFVQPCLFPIYIFHLTLQNLLPHDLMFRSNLLLVLLYPFLYSFTCLILRFATLTMTLLRSYFVG